MGRALGQRTRGPGLNPQYPETKPGSGTYHPSSPEMEAEAQLHRVPGQPGLQETPPGKLEAQLLWVPGASGAQI